MWEVRRWVEEIKAWVTIAGPFDSYNEAWMDCDWASQDYIFPVSDLDKEDA